jgi:riboflavin kinase/FMN adenylyltransferase
MQLIRYLPEEANRASAVAIGNFDGLHRGHQAVIGAMKRAAEAYDLVPTVLTFQPHPRRFFQPEAPPFMIERLKTRMVRLAQEGVTQMVVPRFDDTLARMSASDFMHTMLAKQLQAKVVVTGDNFAFGFKRAGDVKLLKTWGAYNGVEVVSVPPVTVSDMPCSSSAVRAALVQGDMAQVARLLGRAYMLSGRVIHGDGRGKELGFPTANIALPRDLLLPAYGSYAVYAAVEGMTYPAVANLGIRPTFGGNIMPVLEVHLIDVKQEIYEKTVRVFFSHYLRPEQKFADAAALIKQIRHDIETTRSLLGGLD